MKLITLSLLVSALIPYSLRATTTIPTISGVTPTQAILHYHTDKPGPCTIIASESPSLTPPVNDVNTTLFANSNQDSRTGFFVNGPDRYFVLGRNMATPLASDGRVYSRALAAATPHYVQVSCGSDVVSTSFATSQIPLGAVHVDPIPFLAGALGNYAIPYVDFAQPNKSYIDPATGFKFQLVTHPGEMVAGTLVFCGSSSCTGTGGSIGGGGTTPSEILTSTNWSSPTNIYSSNWGLGNTFTTYNTAAQDILTARMEGSCVAGNCFAYGWTNIAGGSGNGGQTSSVDSVQLSFQAKATVAQQIDVALSCNGVTQCTEWEPVNLTTSTQAIVYPANQTAPVAPAVGYAAWQSANFPIFPANLIQLMEQHHNISSVGNVVNIVNYNGSIYVRTINENTFPLDTRVMVPGSKITLELQATVTGGGSPTRVATIFAYITNGAISSYSIADGGAGYTSAPTITVTGPDSGSGATATTTIGGSNGDAVVSVIPGAAGSGYISEFTIASVDAADQIHLTTSPGTRINVPAYWNNFSVMVRRHTASAGGTISIGKLTASYFLSETFNNDGAGFKTYCSAKSRTDANGIIGRMCTFITSAGHSAFYWVTNSGISRFLGRYYVPTSTGSSQDDWNGGFIASDALFDNNDPDTVYASLPLKTAPYAGHPTLVAFKYQSSGVGGCTITAGYQPLVPTSYDSNSGVLDNCNFTATNLTLPSSGNELYTQINFFISQRPASYPGITAANGPTSDKFGTPACGLSFVQNGFAVYICQHSQDSEAWVILINVSSGQVTAVFSTFMNTPKGGCRGCVLHAPVGGSATDAWFSLAFNGYPTPSTDNGQGPYFLTITDSLGTTASGVSGSNCAAIIAANDPVAMALLSHSDGCEIVHYIGTDHVPCRPHPSAWDTINANSCTWSSTAVPSGATQWQGGALQIGDWGWDTGPPSNGFELFAVGLVSNSAGVCGTPPCLILIRNLNYPKGPNLQVQGAISGSGTPPSGNYLRTHTAPWQFEVQCNFPNTGFVSTAETTGTNIVWDTKFWGTGHFVQRDNGIISDEIYAFSQGPVGKSIRIGAFNTVKGLAETNAVLVGAKFAGAQGTTCCSWNQSHPGWDSRNNFFVDMSPFANGSGNIYLWPNTGTTPHFGFTNVSGNLYKINASDNNFNTGLVMDSRRLGIAAWAGAYNFQNISGVGASITGNAADSYKYCMIDYSTATCNQANGINLFNSRYSYQRSIIFAASSFPNTDLTNFPVPLTGTFSYLATAANQPGVGRLQNASGYDVVFSANNDCSSPLKWETVSYNASTGAVEYWIKLPLASHTSPTTIYMCYGDATTTTDQSDRVNTWDSSYKLVQHFKDGTTLSAADATSNANSATIVGATATTGQIDGGAAFNGTNQDITFATPVSTQTSNFTISAWINPSSLSQLGIAVQNGKDDGGISTPDGYGFGVGNGSGSFGNKFTFIFSGTSWFDTGYTFSSTGVWYRLACADSSGLVGTTTCYVNGVATPNTSNTAVATPTKTVVGSQTGTRFFAGSIDEVRVSNVARSADWIAAEYNTTVTAPTIGSEQTGGVGETVGDIFMNIPQATLDHAGYMFDVNVPGVIGLGMEPMTVQQFFYNHLPPSNGTTTAGENLGRWERRLTTALARYAGQDGFANAKMIFASNLIMFNVTAPNLQRTQDLAVGIAPPETNDTVGRNNYIPVNVTVSAGFTYARALFGYSEYGPTNQFYCTQRRETCTTSGVPWVWIGETQAPQSCSAGCVVSIPGISGHVLNYKIQQSKNGTTWTDVGTITPTAIP